jgi:uncharacterized protein (DUF302 family)
MTQFAIEKVTNRTFDAMLRDLPDLLKTEGFGILTQIEVNDVFKQKLNVPFRRYRIFGVCNPVLAHRALSTNLLAGVMLPCNVVVWEGDDGNATVAAIDPREAPAALAEPAIKDLAEEVYLRLSRILGLLEG